jgi:hypothetical protein
VLEAVKIENDAFALLPELQEFFGKERPYDDG